MSLTYVDEKLIYRWSKKEMENIIWANLRIITWETVFQKALRRDFPGGAVVKNPPANAGDTGSSPGPGRSHTPWGN